jgi:hypothetical protein
VLRGHYCWQQDFDAIDIKDALDDCPWVRHADVEDLNEIVALISNDDAESAQRYTRARIRFQNEEQAYVHIRARTCAGRDREIER